MQQAGAGGEIKMEDKTGALKSRPSCPKQTEGLIQQKRDPYFPNPQLKFLKEKVIKTMS